MTSWISKLAQFIREALASHKKKLLLFFLLIPLFIVILFPYNDLSNWLTTKIYDATDQRFYVQTKSFNLSLLPPISIEAGELQIDAGPQQIPSFPKIKMQRLEVAPHWPSLLMFRPGVRAVIENLWKGNFEAAVYSSSSFWSSKTTGFQIPYINISSMNLGALLEFLNQMNSSPAESGGRHGGGGVQTAAAAEGPSDFGISGNLDLNLTDLSFHSNDPDHPLEFPELSLTLKNLKFPQSIPTPGFGLLTIPLIQVAQSQFKIIGKDSLVRIVQGELGEEGKPFHMRILGEIKLQTPSNGDAGVQLGDFNLCMEIDFSDELYAEFVRLIPIIQGFEKFKITSSPNSSGSAAAEAAKSSSSTKRTSYGLKASGADISNIAYWNVTPGNCKLWKSNP